MRLQDITSYLVVIIPFVTADSIINEGLRFRHTNFVGNRRCKNSPQYDMFKKVTPSPVEYMKTPNFDVIFLREENSNPIWRKYEDLFQPIDLRNAQTVEVSYENNTISNADGFRTPISLNRFEVESVLAMLGRKKHIIVLRPRNCKPHYTRRVIENSLMTEFKNGFLHKLLQHLHDKTPTKQMASDMMDPVINRILEVLDESDKRMIEDVKQKFESNSRSPSGQRVYFSKNCPHVDNLLYRNSENKHPSTSAEINSPDNNKHEDPCNDSFVFLLQNQENATDPKALNELVLRVLRVVTESH